MASAFSHAIASIAIGKLSFIKKTYWKFWVLGAVCAAIPDIDAVGYWYGVPYDSLWGHRGITHSFFFAALLSAVITFIFYRRAVVGAIHESPFAEQTIHLRAIHESPLQESPLRHFLFFFACTASHPIIDAMTSGGLGVAFFAPFDDTRYFFPFRPILVSPISITRFFSERGWRVLESEFVWIWIPTIIISGITALIKRLSTR